MKAKFNIIEMTTEMDDPAYMLILIIVRTTLDYSDENPLTLSLGGFVSFLPYPLLDQIWIELGLKQQSLPKI